MIDKYVYPGTKVLKNKLGIKDQEILSLKEKMQTSIVIASISKRNINTSFDFEHLKKIHKELFKSLYDWAGKTRDVDIAKGNTMFCKAIHIEGYAEDIFKNLKKENFFKEYSKDINLFSEKMATLLGDINALHPFREGNGRTQRLFMEELARSNGYELNFEQHKGRDLGEMYALNSKGY